MDQEAFSRMVEDAWARVPEKYRARIENVALLVEDEPSAQLRALEGLTEHETLLGHYHGIPLTERGEGCGTTGVLPDTITLYRLPILHEAEDLVAHEGGEFPDRVRQVVEDTIWHEIGHYFGWGEEGIRHREAEGTNLFSDD